MPLRWLLTRIFPAICLVAVTAMAAPTAAPRTLAIGDPAPAFKVKWIKGKPIAKLESDRVYLLEFWATWCGPCKVAMPHLSELAKKYEGKINIIGVNVFEHLENGRPYETVYPKVKKFVDEMGTKMAYGVAMDTNGQPMVAHWLDAAAQNGIPCSFLIKDGRIVWVGHPTALDTVIPAVLDGTFDMKAFGSEFKESSQKARAERERQMQFLEQIKPIMDLVAARKYSEALELVDSKLAGADAEFKPLLEDLQMRMCIHVDEGRFVALAEKDLKNGPPESGLPIAGIILASNSTSLRLNRMALECYSRLLANPPKNAARPASTSAFLHNQIALCQERCQDLPKAIEEQERAVAMGKQALSEESTEGNEKALAAYENALAEFRQKQQGPK